MQIYFHKLNQVLILHPINPFRMLLRASGASPGATSKISSLCSLAQTQRITWETAISSFAGQSLGACCRGTHCSTLLMISHFAQDADIHSCSRSPNVLITQFVFTLSNIIFRFYNPYVFIIAHGFLTYSTSLYFLIGYDCVQTSV